MAARRRRRSLRRRAAAAAPLALVVLAVGAFAAANAVPATKAGRHQRAIAANDLKPAACAGITVTTLRVVSGSFNGTNAAELILGSAGVDTINGGAGADCIVGGGSNDALRGGGGTDVCIGGPGVDTFPSGCETQIQ